MISPKQVPIWCSTCFDISPCIELVTICLTLFYYKSRVSLGPNSPPSCCCIVLQGDCVPRIACHSNTLQACLRSKIPCKCRNELPGRQVHQLFAKSLVLRSSFLLTSPYFNGQRAAKSPNTIWLWTSVFTAALLGNIFICGALRHWWLCPRC